LRKYVNSFLIILCAGALSSQPGYPAISKEQYYILSENSFVHATTCSQDGELLSLKEDYPSQPLRHHTLDFFSNRISSHDNRDKTSYEAEIQIRRNASVNEALYEEEKNRDLRSGYRQIAYDDNNLVDFIKHYVNPRERTNQILTQISKSIAGECEIESTEIVLSAVVSIDDKDWSWLCFPNFEGRGHLKDLVHRESALKQVIDERTYFFSNDKRSAIKEKKYLPDRRDKTNSNVGSIICWEVTTMIEYADTKETHSLRMIISISTYGKKLIDSEESKEKIDQVYIEVFEKMILNQFKGELIENLIWYGLQNLKSI